MGIVVNILDLILVAQNFGTTKSDLTEMGPLHLRFNPLHNISVNKHRRCTCCASRFSQSRNCSGVKIWHTLKTMSICARHSNGKAACVNDSKQDRAPRKLPESLIQRWIPYHLANDQRCRLASMTSKVHWCVNSIRASKVGILHSDKGSDWDGRNEEVASCVFLHTALYTARVSKCGTVIRWNFHRLVAR